LAEAEVMQARKEVLNIHMAAPLEEYLVQLVVATRQPEKYGDDLAGLLQYGASPRASIAIDRASRAHAWLSGRDYVSPEDVHAVAHDVLRHRLILSFEAEAQGETAASMVDRLLDRIGVP